MKHENPIEEIWRIRDELGAQEGYDVHKLFERLIEPPGSRAKARTPDGPRGRLSRRCRSRIGIITRVGSTRSTAITRASTPRQPEVPLR